MNVYLCICRFCFYKRVQCGSVLYLLFVSNELSNEYLSNESWAQTKHV